MPSSRAPYLPALLARLSGSRAGREERTGYQVQVYLLTVACSFGASLLYAVIYWLLGDPVGALAIGSMTLPALGAVAAYRLTGSPRLGLQVISAGIFTVVTFLVYHQGGMSAPVAPWLLIIPFALMTAGCPGPATIWFVAACLTMAVIGALELAGHPLPMQRGSDPRLLYIVSQPGLCALVFTFLFMVDHARRKALSRLESKNRELEAARDDALQAVRVKSRFLANMSHEIRTPLNGVMGAAEVLATTRLTAEQRDLIDTMKRSGVNLLALINDVLDFSKIEASRLTLEQVDFDVHEAVASVCDLLSVRAAEKQLEFTCSIAPDVPRWLRGDPLRLRQILTNLLGNAIKFTARGEVGIEVTAVPDGDGGHVVRFNVFDTGVGIAPAQVGNLFQAFVQADGSTTRVFGGSGLGLAISSELAQLMTGRIEVDSVEGEGSRFACTLRFDPPSGVPVPAEAADFPTGRRNALVIEPHPRARRVLTILLEQAGIPCISSPWPPDPRGVPEAMTHGAIVFVAVGALTDPVHGPVVLAQVGRFAPASVVLVTPTAAWEPPAALGFDAARRLAKPVHAGTVFSVIRQMDACGPQDAPGPSATDRGLRAHVLLVEDNPVNRQLALAMLRRIGCEVATAPDGAEAVRTWREESFDLILMDCQMPVMDGFDATREIRRMERERGLARTVIVALTANALAEDRAQCLDAGMDDHLGKPFTLDGLTRTVTHWLPPASRFVTAA